MNTCTPLSQNYRLRFLQDSLSEVARLLSDFFWESDVVATDLVSFFWILSCAAPLVFPCSSARAP